MSVGAQHRVAGVLGQHQDTFTLVTAGRETPITGVTRVWRRGRAAKTGAIAGAIVGFASGALLGFVAWGVCDAANCAKSPLGHMVVGGVLVAPFGAGTGALIGLAFPRWNTAWRERSP